MSTRRFLLPAVAAALWLAAPALAQSPQIGFVHPSGAIRGAKSTVTVSGSNLQGATALLVSGTGIQAAIVKNTEGGAMPVELTVAPDAAPGLREVRVVTPRGSSNAGRVWVGTYPDAVETEPNNSASQPQKLEKTPIVVNGQVNGGEDVDVFAFQAQAGGTVVLDLVAAQMASPLDGFLTLTDARGKVVMTAAEGFDRDPRIVYTPREAGTYLVFVRDSMYRGGANFTYRLTVGRVPVVTSYLPRSGRRGETVVVTLQGANLGGVNSVEVQMPPTGAEASFVVETPAGPAANPIVLEATELSEGIESEPNDAAPQASVLGSIPAAISGRIDRPGDVDLYRIQAPAAGNLVAEVYATRIGSKTDPVLRVLDASGNQVSENDDGVGKDSRIVFGAQAGATYLLEVRALARRGGGDHFYRLTVTPPGGQDFRLAVTPDELNVGQNAARAVTVTATRINGFAGPIQLRVDGLPAGVTISPAVIPAGQTTCIFTVHGAADAQPGALGQVRIVGTATIGDQQVERVAEPFETYKQPLAPDDRLSRRKTLIFPATVMPQPPFVLKADPLTAQVKKGTAVQIKVTAIRQMGQNAQINLTVSGQPANVNPALQNIAQNQNEATITLNVAANAPEVTQNILITGTMNNNAQVAPVVTLTIVP